MERFLKGIIVGIGGVAPGLSGSVLLIIFGMYQKTLDALGTLFGNLKKNLRFLLPLLAGMGLGVLLFSRVIDFCLANYEMPTRFCFLGLILGTVPMVWREVRKETFRKWHYLLILLSAAAGFRMFTMNPGTFPQVTDPTVLQSVLLGVSVAATAIIPGVDPAVLLTTLGFYEMYVHALATLELTVLAPMVLGLAAGAVGISFVMSQLFRRFYTATYSVIFGIFLSMIPNMLNDSCVPAMDAQTALSLVLMVLGFGVSFYLGGIGNKKRKKRVRSMIKLIGYYDYTVILTYLSLISAVLGIVSASQGRFTAAVLCLVLSGLCDAFDGMVARSKKNRTEDEKAFGIQIDSLCDAVAFGIAPAMLCYHMGMNGPLGIVILCTYSLCAVIRLAFFNVIEGKRQQAEGGCNKTYRGLPVTTSSMILPLVYLSRLILPGRIFRVVLHLVMAVTAYLFVLDFSVKKPDWGKLLSGAK